MRVCVCALCRSLPPHSLARSLAWSVWESFSNVFSPLDRSHKSLEMFLAGYFIGASDRWPVGWLPPSSLPSSSQHRQQSLPRWLVPLPLSLSLFLVGFCACLLSLPFVVDSFQPLFRWLSMVGCFGWGNEPETSSSERVEGCSNGNPKPKVCFAFCHKMMLYAVVGRHPHPHHALPRSHPGHEMHWPFFSLLQSPRIAPSSSVQGRRVPYPRADKIVFCIKTHPPPPRTEDRLICGLINKPLSDKICLRETSHLFC